MKAVILAAGEGKRLRPITATRPKPLIPIAGKALLEHNILGLKSAGFNQILLIVGYREDQIKDYFKDGTEKYDVTIEYISQEEYLGTAHAAGLAKEFVGNDDFLMMYGDLLVDIDVFKELYRYYQEKKCDGLITLIGVTNPQDYGIISLDKNGFVESIIEKPSLDLNLGNLANAGIFIFNPRIFDAIGKTKKSIRGEYEFTDSMSLLFGEMKGKIVGYVLKDYFWSDIGLPWQLLDANSHLLDKMESNIEISDTDEVYISNNVHIGKDTRILPGTNILGPCYIGEECLIGPNAFIRPYTFIGNHCHVGMSEIKNSMIFSNTNIPHFNYVGDSIICEKVNLGAGTKTSNLRFDNKNVKMNIKGKLIDSGRRKLGVIIGPNVQTGINASIMCGKIIGENSIIGAHTMINEDIPPNMLYYTDMEGKLVKKPNPF